MPHAGFGSERRGGEDVGASSDWRRDALGLGVRVEIECVALAKPAPTG
jgi:hypothetical protein